MTAVSERTEWMDRALCVGADPELWFNKEGRAHAEKICAQCPVTAQCGAAGADEYRGVWGGVRQTRTAVGPSPSVEYLGFPHGTVRGYQRHLRENTPACGRCLTASMFASRDWAARNPRVRTPEELARQEQRRVERLAERRRAS